MPIDEQFLGALVEAINSSISGVFTIRKVRTCTGGCINAAYLIDGDRRSYFVKTNIAAKEAMFAAEALALDELSSAGAIRVPKPIASGKHQDQAYLILEALTFGTPGTVDWELMGQQLARLHRQTQPQFGWKQDNTIGSNLQLNRPTNDWAEFFTEQRIEAQIKLAERNGIRFDSVTKLAEAIYSHLQQHTCQPSLLHGDLWSGNVGFTAAHEPVVFDPASYYGDREADLAFSEFFGGFPECFYRSYEAAWPLAEGYSERKEIYNLYHVLNHANLFGGSYISQAQSIIRQIVS